MKKMISRLITLLVGRLKRSRFLQHIVEAPFELERFDKFGEFKDKHGNVFVLRAGLRSKIKPGWQRMLAEKSKPSYTDAYLSQLRTNGMFALNNIEKTLDSYGKRIKDSKVLEIGCHSGNVSFLIAEKGAESVVGTEFNEYKVKSLDANEVEDQKMKQVDNQLELLRSKLAEKSGKRENVTFVNDNICDTGLLGNEFDIILSWDVLEHLSDSRAAFRNISELLADDGIMIHDYNPFFSLNGGHSLCTLDFLWGHVRLCREDFYRYIDEIRPEEKQKAISFYDEGLNRMTISQVRSFCADAGLEILSIIPFVKEQHLRMVTSDVYCQSKRNFEDLSLTDLVASRILLIAKKKL